MDGQFVNEPMLDMFLFETSQLIEQLEQIILESEKESQYSNDNINEIFRIMHTIKGSAAMMMFEGISSLAHVVEDIFYYIRDKKPAKINHSDLSDLVLEDIDFIKLETDKIKNRSNPDGDPSELIDRLKNFLAVLKQDNEEHQQDEKPAEHNNQENHPVSKEKKIHNEQQYISKTINQFQVVIRFDEGCEMENIRAYTVLHNLEEIAEVVSYHPDDIMDNDDSINVIRKDGFQIIFKCGYSYEKMNEYFQQTIFLKELELVQLENESKIADQETTNQETTEQKTTDNSNTVMNQAIILDDHDVKKHVKERSANEIHNTSTQQSIISVSVSKLDRLMDLVGEMVISEAMVIQNPDLAGLELSNFQKAARQLNKITSEIQDMVMAIRMVPLSATFNKMHRIVRDMCKKLDKDVKLEIIGEETEVDKNIIEHISDPLMHLVRNSLDHGIEDAKIRKEKGKPTIGTVTLEAKNNGSDVLILVKDDGKGINKEKILKKAKENNLLYKNAEDMTDKEIFNLILLPGFSTNESVTEFSGRGVGMDVVMKNIEAIGGSISIESTEGQGTTMILKLPLTLAIIDGMNIRVGNSSYTIPTNSIRESFRPKESDIITDPENNEMIMIRGKCLPILRLHKLFQVNTDIIDFTKGIIIIVEQDEKNCCLFADELVGQQQVVVKALPKYIQDLHKIKGITGCTLLGDGSISLILDIAGLIAQV